MKDYPKSPPSIEITIDFIYQLLSLKITGFKQKKSRIIDLIAVHLTQKVSEESLSHPKQEL